MDAGGSPGSSSEAMLQSQIAALLHRVQELEKEREALLCRISRCHVCSKGENVSWKEKRKKQCEVAMVGDGTKDSFDCIGKPSDNQELTGQNIGLSVENNSNNESISHFRTIYQHQKRYIALKIMYFGKRYYGFASEAQKEPTIESEIFKALEKTRLLVCNKKESCYSRCGRTDKGVSATGQVISLYVRSIMKDLRRNAADKCAVPAENCEIDYVKVLNRVLPKDIRVIGWSSISDDFHARFTCLDREYRYFFWKGNLDTERMEIAASKFIGEHDFRNFCKMDAANFQQQ